jgi:hypothetical protein
MDFPHIDGVEFRHLQGFEGYAVSDNGDVWIGVRGSWRKMTPYQFCDGRMVVSLPLGCSGGRTTKYVDELIQKVFGTK